VSTGRLESFSDGVIAVAITLLVLDIMVPTLRESARGVHLGHELARHWPNYAAYVISFITIGIIWMNHHAMIGRLARADHSILMLNLVLLLTIAVIPFGTSLAAEYLRESHGAKLAVGLYSGIFLTMATAFAALNRQILLRRPEMLTQQLPAASRRKILVRSIAGLPVYLVATGLAAVSPYVTLAICASLALFYAFPIASGLGLGEP
jgi:TMEM175 potassium channel family protein